MSVWAQLGGSLGSSIGQGISGGLQEVANKRIKKLEKAESLKEFKEAGFNDQESMLLSSLPQESRYDALQFIQHSRDPARQMEPRNFQDIVDQERGIMPAFQGGQHILQQLMNPEVTRNIDQQQLQEYEEPQEAAQIMPRQPRIKKASPKTKGLPFSRTSDRKLMNQDQIEVKPLTQIAQKAHLGKDLKKEDFKQAYEYADDISGIGRASKQGLAESKRMEKLNNSGKLSPALWSSAVKLIGAGGYGPDLTSLLSPESVEFDKIATGFLKNAKNYFGSRMTEGEVNLFLRTVPSLMQSQKGRSRLIQNMQNMFEAGNIRAKAIQDIKKELGGRTPANLESLVEEAVGPEIEALHNNFIEGIKSNPTTNKYVAGKTYTNSRGEKAIGVERNGKITLERL